jgi:hypothetical protein
MTTSADIQPPYSDEDVAAIFALHDVGASWREIGRILGRTARAAQCKYLSVLRETRAATVERGRPPAHALEQHE